MANDLTVGKGRPTCERMASNQYGDWQANRSLQECNKYMLENGVNSDVHFQIGEDERGTTLHAHKYVLASRSSVFFAMFYGPMAETADSIIIPDIPGDIFRLFLQYLYTDIVSLTGDNVCSLLYTATKYGIKTLVCICESFLKTNMTSHNVCTIMNTANMLGLQELVTACVSFVLNNQSVFNTSQMNQLCHECFRLIIASDDLGVVETEVLKVVLSWAENQCRLQGLKLSGTNKRNVLGDILFLVRFPLVDPKVFADTADTELLTPEEQLEVFKSVARGKSASRGKFSTKPRSPSYHLCMVPSDVYNDTCPIIFAFQCSKMINLMGILCRFNDMNQPQVIQSTLIIYPCFNMFGQHLNIYQTYRHEARKQQVCSVSTENTEHKIMLPSNVCLQPNQFHLLYFSKGEEVNRRTTVSYSGIQNGAIHVPDLDETPSKMMVTINNIKMSFYGTNTNTVRFPRRKQSRKQRELRHNESDDTISLIFK